MSRIACRFDDESSDQDSTVQQERQALQQRKTLLHDSQLSFPSSSQDTTRVAAEAATTTTTTTTTRSSFVATSKNPTSGQSAKRRTVRKVDIGASIGKGQRARRTLGTELQTPSTSLLQQRQQQSWNPPRTEPQHQSTQQTQKRTQQQQRRSHRRQPQPVHNHHNNNRDDDDESSLDIQVVPPGATATTQAASARRSPSNDNHGRVNGNHKSHSANSKTSSQKKRQQQPQKKRRNSRNKNKRQSNEHHRQSEVEQEESFISTSNSKQQPPTRREGKDQVSTKKTKNDNNNNDKTPVQPVATASKKRARSTSKPPPTSQLEDTDESGPSDEELVVTKVWAKHREKKKPLSKNVTKPTQQSAAVAASSTATNKQTTRRPKHQKDILKVGDKISYYHPLFVAGRPEGYRETTILAVEQMPLDPSSQVDYYPLQLENGEVLCAEQRVRRLVTGRERCIEDFVLIEGACSKGVPSGLDRQVARGKRFLQQVQDDMRELPEHLQDLEQFRHSLSLSTSSTTSDQKRKNMKQQSQETISIDDSNDSHSSFASFGQKFDNMEQSQRESLESKSKSRESTKRKKRRSSMSQATDVLQRLGDHENTQQDINPDIDNDDCSTEAATLVPTPFSSGKTKSSTLSSPCLQSSRSSTRNTKPLESNQNGDVVQGDGEARNLASKFSAIKDMSPPKNRKKDMARHCHLDSDTSSDESDCDAKRPISHQSSTTVATKKYQRPKSKFRLPRLDEAPNPPSPGAPIEPPANLPEDCVLLEDSENDNDKNKENSPGSQESSESSQLATALDTKATKFVVDINDKRTTPSPKQQDLGTGIYCDSDDSSSLGSVGLSSNLRPGRTGKETTTRAENHGRNNKRVSQLVASRNQHLQKPRKRETSRMEEPPIRAIKKAADPQLEAKLWADDDSDIVHVGGDQGESDRESFSRKPVRSKELSKNHSMVDLCDDDDDDDSSSEDEVEVHPKLNLKKRKSSFGVREEAKRRALGLSDTVDVDHYAAHKLDNEQSEDDDISNASSMHLFGHNNKPSTLTNKRREAPATKKGKTKHKTNAQQSQANYFQPSGLFEKDQQPESSDEENVFNGKRKPLYTATRRVRDETCSIESIHSSQSSQETPATAGSETHPLRRLAGMSKVKKQSTKRPKKRMSVGSNKTPGGAMQLQMKTLPRHSLDADEEDDFLF